MARPRLARRQGADTSRSPINTRPPDLTFESGNDAKEGRLAAARGAEQGQELTHPRPSSDNLRQRPRGPERFLDPVDEDAGHRSGRKEASKGRALPEPAKGQGCPGSRYSSVAEVQGLGPWRGPGPSAPVLLPSIRPRRLPRPHIVNNRRRTSEDEDNSRHDQHQPARELHVQAGIPTSTDSK